MTATPITEKTGETSTEELALGLARSRNLDGRGRSNAFCVRITPTVMGLLEAAKPAKQPMVEFLKEAALTVALKRLEDSQR